MIMVIMLVAFGALFAAAGSALRPLAEDADASKAMTQWFQHRGDIEPGTRVRASRLPGSEKRLAQEGHGLVVQLVPSRAVRGRRGGLRLLAMRVASEGLSRHSDRPLDWVEVVFQPLPDEAGGKPLRCLLGASMRDRLGEPKPPLPATWPVSRGA